MTEAMMEKPRSRKEDEKVSRGAEENLQVVQSQRKGMNVEVGEEKIPGRVYYDKSGMPYGVLPSGRRVYFGRPDEMSIRLELEYFSLYPDAREQLYGKSEEENQENSNVRGLEVGLDGRNLRGSESVSEEKIEICPAGNCDAPRREGGDYCPRCGVNYRTGERENSDVGVLGEWVRNYAEVVGTVGKAALKTFGGLASKAALKTFGGLASKTALKTFGGLALKASYPFLGGMSMEFQRDLENLVGKENYDSGKASNTSMVLEFFTYSSLPFVADYMGWLDGLVSGMDFDNRVTFLLAVGIAASKMWEACNFRVDNSYNLKRGSLLGEFLSLPYHYGKKVYRKFSQNLRKELGKTGGEDE